MPTTTEIIEIANASCVYASNELDKGSVVSGLLDKKLPSLIHCTRQGLEWLYELDPSNEDIYTIENYLTSICKHWLRAENSLVGGGIVTSTTSSSSSSASPIDWLVSGTASGTAPLSTGQTTVTLDGSGGMPDLRGFNVDFFRGGIPQYTTSTGDGSNYYNWSSATGAFTLLGTTPEAQLGEQMRISPYR